MAVQGSVQMGRVIFQEGREWERRRQDVSTEEEKRDSNREEDDKDRE